MQIYFHRQLFSHLSRVPILVEGTVYGEKSWNVFLKNLNFFATEEERHENLGWHGVSKLSGNLVTLYFKVSLLHVTCITMWIMWTVNCA